MQKKTRTADFVLVGMFAALMAIGANITSIVPFYRSAESHLRCSRFLCACWSFAGQTTWRIGHDCLCSCWDRWCTCIRTVLGGSRRYFRKSGGFVLSYIPAAWLAGFILEKDKTLVLAAFICSHCRNDRDVCDRDNLYVHRIKCMAKRTNLLSNHMVLHDVVYGKDYALTILLAMLAPKIYRSVSKATSFRKEQTAS